MKIKGVADIVFCIDATGSMGPCIASVLSNIDSFVRSLETSMPNNPVDWRARVIVYRDFNVDPNAIENNFDFVNSASALKSQLDSIAVSGGGDEPESTLDVMWYAIKSSKWRATGAVHKVIVVFTDATPIPNLNPRTLSELRVIDDMEALKEKIMEDRIKLFMFTQRHPIYDEISKWSRVEVVQYDNAVAALATIDFRPIMEKIGKTVSQIASGGGVL
jgi:hypothetical protein